MAGTDSGWEICDLLVPLANAVSGITALAAEIDMTLYETLQSELAATSEYRVVFSPDAKLRRVINRNVSAQQEAVNVQMTLIQSAAGQFNLNDAQPARDFGKKLDELHHSIYNQPITLPAPFGRAVWPQEAPDEPSDEDLSQFSLRVRRISYVFTVQRSGAAAPE